MNKNLPSVLVTGGAGYIGSHTIVELVNSGFHVVVVDDLSKSDRSLIDSISKITGIQIPFLVGNCSDSNFLKSVFSKFPISAVIHFAAYKSVGESVNHPLLYFRNNIGSLISVMEVMQEFNVKDLIFSSSCTVYGEPDEIPVTELSSFLKPESPYGATKQIGEQILEASAGAGFKIISLRYFNPVGAHPTGLIGELPIGIPNNLVPYITQVAAGLRDSLTIFGGDYDTPDGSCIRDFIHVMDVAGAHVKALEYLKAMPSNAKIFDPFNLGTGKGVSVFELIKTFEEANNLKLNYSVGPRRNGDVVRVFADPSKILNKMGWSPRYTLRDAMIHAWNWQKRISGNLGIKL